MTDLKTSWGRFVLDVSVVVVRSSPLPVCPVCLLLSDDHALVGSRSSAPYHHHSWRTSHRTGVAHGHLRPELWDNARIVCTKAKLACGTLADITTMCEGVFQPGGTADPRILWSIQSSSDHNWKQPMNFTIFAFVVCLESVTCS